MKIAIISRSDQSVGGASRAAAILAELLRKNGHTANHWIGHLNAPTLDDHNLIFSHKLLRITRCFRIFSGLLGFFDLLTPDIFYFARTLKREKYDIVHLHDIVKTISPLTINQISKTIPTVQTLHDISPITGGCIYPAQCVRYLYRCGKCPELRKRTWPMHFAFFDNTGRQQSIKKTCYQNVQTIAPCHWMQKLATNSNKFKLETQLIHYGVDDERYLPINQAWGRQVLGLPRDKKIIVFIATSVNDDRKGFSYAVEALKKYSGNKPLFLIIGHPPPTGAYNLEGIDYQMLGFIHDLRLVTLYLSVADAFLFPTLQDNSPFVLLESMAVGTPPVTFDTGGVSESVIHGECGYVAPKGDVEGLIAGLKTVLEDTNLTKKWRIAARKRVEDHFSYALHLSEHLKLYNRLIKNNNNS